MTHSPFVWYALVRNKKGAVWQTKQFMTKELNKNAVSLIITYAINQVITLFVNYFLVAHLLNISEQNIANVGLFFVVTYISITIFYAILSPINEHINKVHIYRIGIVLRVVFVLLIMLLQAQMLDYLIPIAIFQGISSAFYYSSFNAMRNEIIRKHFFRQFLSFSNIVNKIISIVFPILMGSAIDVSSFSLVVGIVFVLTVVQLGASMFLHNPYQKPGSFDLIPFFKTIKEKGAQKMFAYEITAHFVGGLRNSTNQMIVFLTLLTFTTNTNLGILTSIFAVFNIMTMIFFSKKYTYQKAKWLLPFVALMMFGSIITMTFALNRTTLIIFNFAFYALGILPNAVLEMRRNTIVKSLKMYEYIVENMFVTEVALNIGRIISYSILIYAGYHAATGGTTVALVSIAIFNALFGLLTLAMEKAVNKFDYAPYSQPKQTTLKPCPKPENTKEL